MRLVRLGTGVPEGLLEETVERAAAAVAADGEVDLAAALALGRDLGGRLGPDDPTRLTTRWSVLATLGAVDLTVARAVEPHLDALAILHEAGGDGGVDAVDDEASWGVYAAEGPQQRLEAEQTAQGWRLTGVKPWCSLGRTVDRALLTAWVGDERALFAVRLDDPGVRPIDGPPWVARGLAQVDSSGLRLDAVAAEPVGGPGWYLVRPGFWRGGIGVAAVWYGATVALARRLAQAAGRREPDQVALLLLGRVDSRLVAARAVLEDTARRAAAGAAPDETLDGALLALRARQAVADAVEDVVALVGRGLGPGPLTTEEDHARRVADLQVYVRQHHGERDLARQGERVLAGTGW